MTDLVTRTAEIAERARAAEPTREELRIQFPEAAAWMDEVRRNFGKPVYMRFELGRFVVEWLNPETVDRAAERKRERAVQVSPPAPVPPKRRGEK